jgi:hypothetical protein
MSVMMSVMKTVTKSAKKAKPAKEEVLPKVFTVRDMNRNTARVLAACRQHGRVVVRSREGEQFEMAPVKAPETPEDRLAKADAALERLRLHRERMRTMGCQGPTTPEGIEHLNKIIAGEI